MRSLAEGNAEWRGQRREKAGAGWKQWLGRRGGKDEIMKIKMNRILWLATQVGK